MGFVLIVVVVFVLLVVLVNDIPRRRRRARRTRTRAEREQLARARGWTFTPTDPSYVNRWRGDPFGRPGSRREVHNVISGTASGAAFAIFDYERIHTVQRGVSVSFETVTVWAVQIPTALRVRQHAAIRPSTTKLARSYWRISPAGSAVSR